MNMQEALDIAKANPGMGVRDDANMQKRWKVVYIKWDANKARKIKAGGDFFCINPITGSDYKFTPTEDNKTSTKWRHA